MDDLVQFLRARFNEDEGTALDASPGPWRVNAEADEVVAVDGIAVADGFALSGHQLRATTEHIARHDPARILREISAKRSLASLHRIVHRDVTWLADGGETSAELPVCGLCVPKHSSYRDIDDVPEGPCPTLRLLAHAYADHPDYRPHWDP